MSRTAPARVLIVLASLLAALSVGGAFVVGVVLAPSLVLLARHASRVGAWGYGLLAGVLATEVAWGLTYLLVGELEPTIWLVPAIAGVATVSAALAINLRGGTAADT